MLLPLLAQAYKGGTAYKRTIVKEFSVSNNAVLSLSNKYGKIIFHTWNKNEVKATITVTGFGKNDEQARSIAEMVDIRTDKSNSTAISLHTVYSPSKGGSGWFPWGGNKMDSKDYVNIDYDIYIPQTLQSLLVQNQFGDVIADKFSFPATLELNYCTYDIREADELNLKINYCDKGKIGKAGKVNVRGNYSNLRADQLAMLETSSNYSEYTIAKLGSLKISANYDDYKIEQAGQVSGRCTYSDIRLTELQQEIDMSTTYGDVTINKVGGGFKQADFQMTYSGLKMNFARRQPLSIQANLVYGELKTGDLELKNVNSLKKNASLVYSAQAGGGSESSPYIKIRGTNTDVKLNVY